jgi:hypothetical protein
LILGGYYRPEGRLGLLTARDPAGWRFEPSGHSRPGRCYRSHRRLERGLAGRQPLGRRTVGCGRTGSPGLSPRYFRHAVAKQTFSTLDYFTWRRVARMLMERHH